MTGSLFFLPGNHLYPSSHLRRHRQTPIVMVEDESICRRRPYHQQKLGLVISAMREHANQLKRAGFTVNYFPLARNHSISTAVEQTAAAVGARQLITFEITDRNLCAVLQRLCAKLDLHWHTLPDPGFLTSRSQFADFASGKTRLRMSSFYQDQRRRLQVLLEPDNTPVGRWSFDEDNRKRLPGHQAVPDIPQVKHSQTTASALKEVAMRFHDHPGNAADLWMPTTRRGSLHRLKAFIEDRLIGFGTYEDALSQRSRTLFHSTLSPLINLGHLTPDEVLHKVMQASERVPINDLEGFVRQLIGWREFMRGVYDCFGHQLRSANTRSQNRGLARCWHTAATGIPPLDRAIKTQHQLAWNHHIERLMVIANIMNLCEIHPRAVYEYFMANYLDAYDWVMEPNVYGMGLNSEGGVFATKPYICASNYLLKMSDHKRGDWCDIVDGLYWRFIARHRNSIQRNARMANAARALDRLDNKRRTRITAAAERFLDFATTTQ